MYFATIYLLVKKNRLSTVEQERTETTTKAIPTNGMIINRYWIYLPYLILSLCSNFFSMTIFHFHQEFKYWLRGQIGDEKVTIIDGNDKTSMILGRKDELFIAQETQIRIDFLNDDGPRDVYFHSEVSTVITSEYHFTEWGCGQKDEDERCDDIRKGNFYWSDKYTIIFGGLNSNANPFNS